MQITVANYCMAKTKTLPATPLR